MSELTFDVGKPTSYVGELVVGEVTRWRNDWFSSGHVSFEQKFQFELFSIFKKKKKTLSSTDFELKFLEILVNWSVPSTACVQGVNGRGMGG